MEKEDIKKILGIINEWIDAAKKQKNCFAKFALEYFAFNALLRLNFSPNEDTTDRYLIERLKGCLMCKSEVLQRSKKDIKELRKITEEIPLKNLTRNKSIKIENGSDWNNIVEAVYVIRNNLFHGHKSYSRKRDERLVAVGYKILKSIDKCLIENLRKKYNINNDTH